jgi:hypothetical protein
MDSTACCSLAGQFFFLSNLFHSKAQRGPTLLHMMYTKIVPTKARRGAFFLFIFKQNIINVKSVTQVHMKYIRETPN